MGKRPAFFVSRRCLVRKYYPFEAAVFLFNSSSSTYLFTAGNPLVWRVLRACDQAYSFHKNIDFFNCFANMGFIVYVGFFNLFYYMGKQWGIFTSLVASFSPFTGS